MELLIIWIAIASIVVAVICTSPAWALGRLASFTAPGVSRKVPGLRSSLNRWMLFLILGSSTGVAYFTLISEPHLWVLALALLGSAASQFAAFMIGAGARDAKLGYGPAVADRAHLAPRKIDSVDRELMDMANGL